MTDAATRVLVVDPDPANVALVTELCRSLGYEVETASDTDSALESVQRQRPDIVLLEIAIPDQDGFAILETLKYDETTRDLPVIIVTSMVDIDAKVRGIELGADDYLTKPFKLFELQTRIRAALQVRRYHDQLREAQEALARHAGTDPVTGAGIFAQLHAHLDYEVTRARRYGRPLAALFCSIDHLGTIREQLGRQAADQVLREVVKEMRSATRTVDRVFRLDDEEFVLLLPETEGDGAVAVAQRIQEQVIGLNLDGQDLSVSIGVATFPHSEIRGGEGLLRAASSALRAALERGPGCLAKHE